MIIYPYFLQIDNENLNGEEVQQTKYNPEPRIIRPWEPECKKREFNPEPANIKPGTPECKKRKINPEPVIISAPNSYAGAPGPSQLATTPDSYGGTPLVGANPYAVGYPPYSRTPHGTLIGQAPLTYPTHPVMPHQPYSHTTQQPLAYHSQGQQPLAYHSQEQQPLAYHPQGQQHLTYYTQEQQPLEYHPQGQEPLAYYNQGQQPLSYHPQGQRPLAYEVYGQPYYPTPQGGEPNHYLLQNPGQQPQY